MKGYLQDAALFPTVFMNPISSILRNKLAGICAGLLLSGAPTASAAGEPFRPQFHFTPERNWLNDPNGLVYYAGEYHLFFQYNPFGIGGVNKSWGHAVSRDLVRWEELPVALQVDNGIEIFSGSAVIDRENTSGFGTGAEPPMVAIYTGHGAVQDQRIAYSNDRGRTWTNYAGNPVINIGSSDFRDPKVFWHEPTGKWVMVVALPGPRKIRIYSSLNLKTWTQLSEFGPAGSAGGVWECPDLFTLPIEGEGTTRKWVMTVSVGGGAPAGGTGSQYFVGEFDGATFIDDATLTGQPPLPDGVVLADFEGASYGTWTKTGTAFGNGPAAGTLASQQPVTGYRGSKLVNSFLGGDGPTGMLTSSPFEITRQYINFLIGGGNHPGQTCVNLIVGGNTVRTTTGADSERLDWKYWDVSPYAGQNGVLQIVDSVGGGWGHVNVDHFLMSDSIVPPEPDPTLWTEHGPDNYAPVSWSDIPESDGRRLWIGWMTDLRYAGAVPTTPWRGGMTLPRELVLKRTSSGLRMAQRPVEELKSCRRNHLTHGTGSIADLNAWLASQEVPKLFECIVELEVPAGESAGLRIGTPAQHTLVTWDRVTSRLSMNRNLSGLTGFSGSFPGTFSAPVLSPGNRLKVHLLVDSASVEAFAGDGTATLSALVFPDAVTKGLQFTGPAGAQIVSFDLWEMGSIHPSVPTGLVGQWLFDEETPGTYIDSSGNGNSMTAAANLPAPAVASGAQGNAVEIRRIETGQQVTSLEVPAANSLMPGSFTVSYHFNPKANDNLKLPQLRWETPAGLAWGFEILVNRRMNFYVFDSDSANDVQSVAALPFEAFDTSAGTADNLDNDPAWHHVAATYDSLSGKLTLHLDGVKSEKIVTGLVGSPRYGTAGTGGGIRSGGGLTIYDDLRIYSEILSDSNVAFLRQNPGLAFPAGDPEPVTPAETSFERHGSSFFVHWPTGTGLALWKSATLADGDWTRVPGSEFLTTYATVISNEEKAFFRLAAP